MFIYLPYITFILIGCVRIRKNWGDGCISQVITPVKQVFQLIRASSFESQEDSRFQYFKESVLNQVLRLNQAHTLIVTPSYLSFIRVRNELIRREVRTVLWCWVVYFTLLSSTPPYGTVLHCTVLYCNVLYCTVLYCTVLYCTVLNLLSSMKSNKNCLLCHAYSFYLTFILLGQHSLC